MMEGKTVLITGGNAGIGYATAVGLAEKGARTIIVTRNERKGEKAVKEIKEESGSDKVSFLTADLSSQKEVRALASAFKERYDKLDVLINNAGAFFSEFKLTGDGIERQWAINHLAPFLLTNLLLDTLKKSAPARIVNVSSRAHYRGEIHFDDLNLSKNYRGYPTAYAQSKLANVLFTYELDRRLQGTDVTANCLHPGVVKTSIAQKNSSGISSFIWGLFKPFMVTPEEGAKTSIYLASSPEVEGVSGKYFDNCKPKKSSKLSHDIELAKKLWEVSEEQVGLK